MTITKYKKILTNLLQFTKSPPFQLKRKTGLLSRKTRALFWSIFLLQQFMQCTIVFIQGSPAGLLGHYQRVLWNIAAGQLNILVGLVDAVASDTRPFHHLCNSSGSLLQQFLIFNMILQAIDFYKFSINTGQYFF